MRSVGRGCTAMPSATTRCGSSYTRWPTTSQTYCARWHCREEVEHWSLTTLREKLVEIGARIVRHGRYVVFQLAEVAGQRALFAEIMRRIDRLRPNAPGMSWVAAMRGRGNGGACMTNGDRPKLAQMPILRPRDRVLHALGAASDAQWLACFTGGAQTRHSATSIRGNLGIKQGGKDAHDGSTAPTVS